MRGHFYVASQRTDTLQALRLAHALAETSWQLHISEDLAERYAFLAARFPFQYTVGRAGAQPLPVIEDHAVPMTGAGRVTRPLVFPHSIVDHCRSLWSDRTVQFSFGGVITPSRKAVLDDWLLRAGVKKPSVPWNSRRSRLHRHRTGGLRILATDAGRVWPTKAWDADYFATLGRSRFVLCPNGDFVWTYRFFESALCGAIPVTEGVVSGYDGFRFARMSDDPSSLQWSEDDAEHNYRRVRALISVPIDELDAEITRLLT